MSKTITPACPECHSDMILRTRKKDGVAFYGCSEYPDCNAAISLEAATGEDLDEEGQEIADAMEILQHELVRSSKAAPQLLKALTSSPAKVLPLILGTKTPGGKPTVETLLKQRLKAKKKTAAKPVKKRKKKGKKREKPEDVTRDLHLYGSDDVLEGAALSVVNIPEGDTCRVSSHLYPHHELVHQSLNPVQSRVFDIYDKDCNVVIAASTSAGKTLSAEILMGDAIDRNAKAIFLSPLRAVSQEKYDEWGDEEHPWSEDGVEIITGDYSLTEARKKSLHRASVIVMTSEMLDSKTRRIQKPENSWLRKTLCLVVDEAHLLCMEGRGDALEAGLMRFTKGNPHARIVLLSATMPNVDELGEWLTKLNGKPTRVIESEWRPTTLAVNYVPYDSKGGWGSYQKNETAKRDAAIRLIQRYPNDKWIIFVHSKKAGNKLLSDLKERHESVEFHSADLNREQRHGLEKRFRHGDLRVVIATSTLAYGINMPARRVCVLGIHRGMDKVSPIDVKQMVGRAGRVGLDPRGDAYVLLPDEDGRQNKFERLREEFSEIGLIRSQINDIDTLAFHLTAEIAEGDVRTLGDADAWHERSLAHHQGATLGEDGSPLSVGRVMGDLAKAGILKQDGDDYEATALGRVSSWLYYSPFDISDWCSNFRWISERDKHRDDDLIAWALGKVRTAYSDSYLPKEHNRDMSDLEMRLRNKGIDKLNLPPACLAFSGMLSGQDFRHMASYQRQLSYDAERIAQAVSMVDQYVIKGLGKSYCELLTMRLRYGCSWTEADLCRLSGVGAKRARRLIREGITSIRGVLDDRAGVVQCFGQKTATSVIRSAKEILKNGS